MPTKPLSQEELKRWWPFDRLDPKLMPKPPKQSTYPTDAEESPL